jgi:hypothetical protein
MEANDNDDDMVAFLNHSTCQCLCCGMNLVLCMARPQAVSRAKPATNRPGQAKPSAVFIRLWPGSCVSKAKAGPSGRDFLWEITDSTYL